MKTVKPYHSNRCGKKIISENKFVDKHKQSSQDISRNRVFTFQTTFLFICSFLHKRTQTELDRFFSKLQSTSESLRTVTSSSFTQIRDKISFTAFKPELFMRLD